MPESIYLKSCRLRPATFTEKGSGTGLFQWILQSKFLRTHFLQKTSGRLMLLRRLAWLWITVHAEEMESKLSISIWYSSFVSRVLRHKRIKLSLAKWIKIMIFKPHQSFRNSTGPYQWRRLIFIGKNCDEYWKPTGKGISPKVFPRVFPRNHELILRNKKKNKLNRDWNIRTRMKDRKMRCLRVLIFTCTYREFCSFFAILDTRKIFLKRHSQKQIHAKYAQNSHFAGINTRKKNAQLYSVSFIMTCLLSVDLDRNVSRMALDSTGFFSFFFRFEVVWHLSVAHSL